MSHTVENPDNRVTLGVALHGLVDSANVYLELLKQLYAEPGDEGIERDLDVDLSATSLLIHASSTKELFESLLDNLPDETDDSRRQINPRAAKIPS